MSDSLTTRPSLLIRIRDAQDQEAWRQFVKLYAPLVYGFARKRGLQDADAADLVQDVFQQVATWTARSHYDADRGSFRTWLFTVIRNRMHALSRAQRRQIRGSGDSAVQGRLEQEPDPQEEASLWDKEYEQRLFDWAAKQVREEFAESSWQAFWQTAMAGKSAKETAAGLGMSVGAVYIAKSRIVARLTEHIRELEG